MRSRGKTHNDADAAEVTSVEFSLGGVHSGDCQENNPSDNTDDENTCNWQSTSLLAVGEGREQDHEDESDGVGRDGVQLSLCIGVAEALDAGARRKVGPRSVNEALINKEAILTSSGGNRRHWIENKLLVGRL